MSSDEISADIDRLPVRVARVIPEQASRYRWQGIAADRWYEVSDRREHSRNPDALWLFVDFTWVEVRCSDLQVIRPDRLAPAERAEVAASLGPIPAQDPRAGREAMPKATARARLLPEHAAQYPDLAPGRWYPAWTADQSGGLWLETSRKPVFGQLSHFEVAGTGGGGEAGKTGPAG